MPHLGCRDGADAVTLRDQVGDTSGDPLEDGCAERSLRVSVCLSGCRTPPMVSYIPCVAGIFWLIGLGLGESDTPARRTDPSAIGLSWEIPFAQDSFVVGCAPMPPVWRAIRRLYQDGFYANANLLSCDPTRANPDTLRTLRRASARTSTPRST